MKKILSLSPILLTLTWIIVLSACVSCTTNEKSDENHTNNNIYQNVGYRFDIDEHCYKVYLTEKIYNVPPRNYYEIELDSYKQAEDFNLLENEYFVSTNELFVYYIK